MSDRLKSIIQNNTANIGVIGLGYVGLPLAVEFGKAGFNVTGIDISEKRVAQLNAGDNYIADVDDEEFNELISNGRFTATTSFDVVKKLDVVSICVPTPLNKLKDPDVSYIVSVVDELIKYLHDDLLIVLESTTYPGTTRELVFPKLEEAGYPIGGKCFLCFSPERVDPGNPVYKTHNTPKVLGGITETCTNLGVELYKNIVTEVVPVSSPEAAELTKLLENTFRSINIGLANEMAIMCEKLGVDVWEVINAADTKPFGFMKFTPGPGLGGHCIPIDPHYLAWKMKSLDYKARFIALAGEINTGMPILVLELNGKGLNRIKKPMNGSKVLMIGVAYKKDIDDVRESPALDVLKLLEQEGATVDYYDPFVPKIHWNGTTVTGISELTEDVIKDYDAVAILTDHSNIDFDFVLTHSTLIIDTRNVYPADNNNHVLRLGVG